MEHGQGRWTIGEAKDGNATMKNVQRRVIPAPLGRLGHLIDDLADPARSVWPGRAWPGLHLDNGPTPGSTGGHATIRYTVTAYEPGRRLAFAFHREVGLDGWHELTLTAGANGHPVLVHTIEARTTGRMRLAWPLVVRWIHEAVVQDLFDNAELAATGTLAGGPARWSRWVRLLRWWRTRYTPPSDPASGDEAATHPNGSRQ